VGAGVVLDPVITPEILCPAVNVFAALALVVVGVLVGATAPRPVTDTPLICTATVKLPTVVKWVRLLIVPAYGAS
jgi:hypothetical protein